MKKKAFSHLFLFIYLFIYFFCDELSEVEWNFVTSKRGLFNIIVYETLSGKKKKKKKKENSDLNGVTTYPGDDL